MLSFNDKYIQIQHYTEYGDPDGIVIESRDNIEGIDSRYKYARAIEFLHMSKFKNTQLDRALTISQTNTWKYKLLSKFKGKDNVLALKHEDQNTYYGKINDIDKEFIKIETVGSIGELEGFYTMRIRDLLSLHINSVEGTKRNTISKREKASS